MAVLKRKTIKRLTEIELRQLKREAGFADTKHRVRFHAYKAGELAACKTYGVYINDHFVESFSDIDLLMVVYPSAVRLS